MKTSPLLLVFLLCSSCAGLKVQRTDSIRPEPKPGLTLNGGFLSGGGIEKGYWCDVRGPILTFGSAGPTEAKATEIAKANCHATYPNSSCELVSCKQN